MSNYIGDDIMKKIVDAWYENTPESLITVEHYDNDQIIIIRVRTYYWGTPISIAQAVSPLDYRRSAASDELYICELIYYLNKQLTVEKQKIHKEAVEPFTKEFT